MMRIIKDIKINEATDLKKNKSALFDNVSGE